MANAYFFCPSSPLGDYSGFDFSGLDYPVFKNRWISQMCRTTPLDTGKVGGLHGTCYLVASRTVLCVLQRKLRSVDRFYRPQMNTLCKRS